jgi:hypothetical protein
MTRPRFRRPIVAALLTLCMLTTRAVGAGAAAPRHVGESPANESTIVCLPDDSLRIYYIVQPARTELRSTGSTDNGKTWGDDRLEFKLPGTAYYANQVLVDSEGELHAAFHILGKGDKGYNGRHYDVWHAKTSGGRKSWGEPKRIFEGYVGSMRGFAQLQSGRLLIPASVAVPQRQKKVEDGKPDYGWNDVAVFYSDDKGDTWKEAPKRLSILQDNTRGRTRYGAVEPHVAQLADGRAWMLIRTKNGFLYESYSPDGIAWSEATPSKFISSDSPATTARLKDGRLALFLNVSQRWDDPMSYAIGGREVLHAAISGDEGRTWQGFREVLYDFRGAGKGDRGTAYPSAVQTADGTIALVSGQGEGRKSILLVDPKWLSDTSALSTFAPGEWPQWTTHEGRGAEVVDHPDKAGAKCLAIRKTEAKAVAGAAWNFPMAPAGKLTLRIKPKAGFGGAVVSLTDHYAVTGDTRADDNGVYSIRLDDSTLAPDQWHDVAFEWKPGADATVTIDGRPAAPIKPGRVPAFGLNYVRVRSAAEGAEDGGFLIESATANNTAANAAAISPPVDDALALEFRKVRGSAAGGALLDVGGPGAFDERWVTCPSVLRDRDRFRMWYSAYFNAQGALGGIGLATSGDGVSWVRHDRTKPVLAIGPAGAFDDAQVFGPSVLHDGTRYLMWYTGDAGEKHPSGIFGYQIGLATSTDGVMWTRANDGRPVLGAGPTGSPDEVQVATPSVLRDGDRGYRMWYAAWSPKHNHTICVARSADGIAWTRENGGEPVEGLNPSIAYGHSVARVGGRYVMLYMALEATRDLYGATSKDGTHWTMLDDGKPVLTTGATDDFDANIVGHPHLLAEGNTLRAWYTGYQTKPGGLANWELRIGLADAPLLTAALANGRDR